jgi:hypothetical protein
MDKATAARRVRSLRALSVDPGATDSERARAKEAAERLEKKYNVTGGGVPPISYPRVTSTRESHDPYVGPTRAGKSNYYARMKDPTWHGQEDYAAWIMGGMKDGDMDFDDDDIVEEGYGWSDPEYYDGQD